MRKVGRKVGWQVRMMGGLSLCGTSGSNITSISPPSPPEWFPLARSMNRTLYLHIGPTNSGKTYHALKALQECNRGLYAGPLRLLAWEVYENLTEHGLITNLMTGQERSETKGATHT